MPKRALVERRPWLLGSLAAAIAYAALQDEAVGGLYLIGMKGGAIAMLAIYALLRFPGADTRLLAGSLALAAGGEMLSEVDPDQAPFAFVASHLLAIALFLRHRRGSPTASQKATSIALLLLTPLIAFLLTAGWDERIGVFLYALTLGAMAATAWHSRFPRYRVGIGSVLVVASRLLGIAGLGLLAGSSVAGAFTWPLFYAGQFLVCIGVVTTLRRDHRA